jgi:hypothetical protein
MWLADIGTRDKGALGDTGVDSLRAVAAVGP